MIKVPTITGEKFGKYELTLVSTDGIPHVLPRFEKDIRETFEDFAFTEYGYEEVERRLLAGEAQLWIVAENGAKVVLVAVTRVLRYPSVKRLAVDLIVGEDLEGCVPLMEIGAKWARQFGCTEIEATCRPGVRKVMERHGFMKYREVIVRSISGSTH